MKKKSLGTILAVGVGLTFAVASPVAANAALEYPAGGTWYYGVTGNSVYSHYYHNTKTHKATACGAQDLSGWCQTTGWKSRGVAALANQPAKISGNTAYYNVS
ncbi:lactococcin 972 family bacteriocin [Microbacterium stercoris]|uniref:Lactococcin 972 family bacteriocin n=1 Tax=Microbacterium stercoris TaxID=2820289 RepID=A0A939TQF9_9MICO|nr:lactococcin 972 family bacteriocin [Microbacterium stercoris]MBO3663076.1 lactococcin 972 family bacteriocin [Microbacterium stercoris]